MLDRVHKIAEIIAAFAIVGSLIFVGLQLNQNTQAIAAQEDSSTYLPWFTFYQMVVSSPDFADILVRGQAGGLEVLSEAEKVRFSQYHFSYFSIWEQNYRAWRRDPEMWEISWLRAIIDDTIKVEEGHNNKGSREVWAESNNFFTREFVVWADQSVD